MHRVRAAGELFGDLLFAVAGQQVTQGLLLAWREAHGGAGLGGQGDAKGPADLRME